MVLPALVQHEFNGSRRTLDLNHSLADIPRRAVIRSVSRAYFSLASSSINGHDYRSR